MMNEYQFDEINIGQEVSFQYEIDEQKMNDFSKMTGDENLLHTELEYAQSKGYQEKVVYGLLTAGACSTLAGMHMPGKDSVIHTIELSFLNPVYLSACPLKVVGKVVGKDERFHTIDLKVEMFNIQEQKVCKGKMRVGILK